MLLLQVKVISDQWLTGCLELRNMCNIDLLVALEGKSWVWTNLLFFRILLSGLNAASLQALTVFNHLVVCRLHLRTKFLSFFLSLAQTSMSLFKSKDFSVKRRFSDFLGLHSKLASKYLHVGYIVPPAPEKSIVGKWSHHHTLPLSFRYVLDNTDICWIHLFLC